MIVEHEPDWDGDLNHYFSGGDDEGHPILLAFLTTEQWVSSDGDLVRAITLLASTLRSRLARTTGSLV